MAKCSPRDYFEFLLIFLVLASIVYFFIWLIANFDETVKENEFRRDLYEKTGECQYASRYDKDECICINELKGVWLSRVEQCVILDATATIIK